MERNDKIGYHTQKKQQAERNIEWLDNRIEWLKHGENHCLQLEEVAALVKLHRYTLDNDRIRLKEAIDWLSAAAKDIEPTWLHEKTERLADLLLGERLPLDFVEAGEVLIRAGQKIT